MIRSLFVLGAALAALSGSPRFQQAPPSPEVLAGRWLGQVTADAGEMPIELVLSVSEGKVTGHVRTFHGDLPIASAAREADGRWRLPFKDEEDGTGSLVGTVTGDVFAGDWNYAPRARGTFEVKRVKG